MRTSSGRRDVVAMDSKATTPGAERHDNDRFLDLSRQVSELEWLVNLAMSTGRQVVRDTAYQCETARQLLLSRITALEAVNSELRDLQADHNRRLETIAQDAIHEEQTRVRQVLDRHLSVMADGPSKDRVHKLMAALQTGVGR